MTFRARWRKLGFDPDEVVRFIQAHHGRCDICGSSPGEKALCVDHGHESKTLRGLLCNQCNGGLGFFKDDITILQQAIIYLQKA